MSKDNAQRFSDAFSQFLDSENLKQTYLEKKLMQSWEKIMGKPIASRTHKIQIIKGVMYVHLNSAPLKQELYSNKEKVVSRITEEMGSKVIEDIKFI